MADLLLRLWVGALNAQLPYGGREIAELRAKRQRPADMVIVSLLGPLREHNPLIIARPDRHYDWRFLAGLEVLVVASMDIPAEQINRISKALLDVRPDYLGVWFADLQNGMSVAFGSWRPKSKTCRMMGVDDRRRLAGLGRKA